MPGGDGTGPLGQGPRMGRNDNRRSGRGCGRGMGMRCRNLDNTRTEPQDISRIEESLEQINSRLSRLEEEAGTEQK